MGITSNHEDWEPVYRRFRHGLSTSDQGLVSLKLVELQRKYENLQNHVLLDMAMDWVQSKPPPPPVMSGAADEYDQAMLAEEIMDSL